MERYDHCTVDTVQLRRAVIVPGIIRGPVYFGVRTFKCSKLYLIVVIEAIYLFGSKHGVNFSEKTLVRFEWVNRWVRISVF